MRSYKNVSVTPPTKLVNLWRPRLTCPENLLIVGDEKSIALEVKMVREKLAQENIKTLEIDCMRFKGVDIEALQHRSLLLHNLDQCRYASWPAMRMLLQYAADTEMLVIATANSDLVRWDNHADMGTVFPEARFLFDGGRACVARDVWYDTLVDNPALVDHMNQEERDRMSR